MTDTPTTDAALAGADVELTDQAPGGQPVDNAALDEATLATVRQSLPGWDVQPFQLCRAADVPDGVDALRTSLEQVAQQQGRTVDVLVTGQHLVARVSSQQGVGVTGVTEQDVDLAVALDAVFSAPQTTGSDPGGH